VTVVKTAETIAKTGARTVASCVDMRGDPSPASWNPTSKVAGAARGELEMIIRMIAAIWDEDYACDDPRVREAVIEAARENAPLHLWLTSWVYNVTRAWSEGKGNPPDWWDFTIASEPDGSQQLWRLLPKGA
jgi:hypothetical protein